MGRPSFSRFVPIKSKKVTISSTDSEAVAISAGADLAIWYQYYMFGVITGKLHVDHRRPRGQLSLLNPLAFGTTKNNFPTHTHPHADIWGGQKQDMDISLRESPFPSLYTIVGNALSARTAYLH